MPFRLDATTHVFNKTPTGGIQRVSVKDPNDAEQLRLVRRHLAEIAEHFAAGDFSDPTAIHGQEMPGLAQLKQARRGSVDVRYQDVSDGAQIEYATKDPALRSAIHAWFDAQLSDHGADATEVHHHSHQ
jgi:hypothetical protein